MPDRGNEIVGVVNHMKKKGSLKIVIIGFMVGLSLLLVGSFAFSDKEKSKNDAPDDSTGAYSEFLEYKADLKEEIESICKSVRGVNKAYALLYFDGIGESIYAQNVQSGNTNKTEYVIIGSGSSSHALYLGESLPQLSGIGVVCECGGSDAIKNEIAALLSAAYGIPLTRIHVSEG